MNKFFKRKYVVRRLIELLGESGTRNDHLPSEQRCILKYAAFVLVVPILDNFTCVQKTSEGADIGENRQR